MRSSPIQSFIDPAFVEVTAEDTFLTELIRPHFFGPNERLIIFAFDDLGRLVGFQESGDEHVHCAHLSPTMLRRTFAIHEARHLLLAHNHPSGEASPSKRDLDLTQKIANACRLAGLAIADHVILTDAGHFSFRAAGLV